MEYVRGKAMEDVELIDWEDASRQCGGDERDDGFLMELLVTYYEDGLPRVQHLLQAALAFRAGQDTIDAGSGPRAVELVIKEEAHALKGSAANVRLWRLAKAAEDVELPCKTLIQSGAPPDARRAMLAAFCTSPCTELRQLVTQFHDFVAFVERDARGMVLPEVDLAEVLDESLQAQLEEITLANYDAAVAPYAAFWQEPAAGGSGSGGSAPAASATAPPADECAAGSGHCGADDDARQPTADLSAGVAALALGGGGGGDAHAAAGPASGANAVATAPAAARS